MAVWQKIYLCSNPQDQNQSRRAVTARLIGTEEIRDPWRDTLAGTPHLDWSPAVQYNPSGATEVRFFSGSNPNVARSIVGPGGSITICWSVYDGACQLSGLVWDNGDAVNPYCGSSGSLPGGGVAFWDEDDRLTIAITNDLEGDRQIDLSKADFAITSRALAREQFCAMFSRFTRDRAAGRRVVASRPTGRLAWQALRDTPAPVQGVQEAQDVPQLLEVRGHDPTSFLSWGKFVDGGLRLDPGQYTALSVGDMAPGGAILMRGEVYGEEGHVLSWAEQVSVHEDCIAHGRGGRRG